MERHVGWRKADTGYVGREAKLFVSRHDRSLPGFKGQFCARAIDASRTIWIGIRKEDIAYRKIEGCRLDRRFPTVPVRRWAKTFHQPWRSLQACDEVFVSQ